MTCDLCIRLLGALGGVSFFFFLIRITRRHLPHVRARTTFFLFPLIRWKGGRALSAHRRIDSGEGGGAAAAVLSLSFRSTRSSPACSLSADSFLSSAHFIPKTERVRKHRAKVLLAELSRPSRCSRWEIAMLQTRDLIWTVLLFGHAGKDGNKIFLFFVFFERCYDGI